MEIVTRRRKFFAFLLECSVLTSFYISIPLLIVYTIPTMNNIPNLGHTNHVRSGLITLLDRSNFDLHLNFPVSRW